MNLEKMAVANYDWNYSTVFTVAAASYWNSRQQPLSYSEIHHHHD